MNNALGGTGNGVFSSSWDINGNGGGAIGTFGPGSSNQMTLIDSATGQKVILVNGCLVNTADSNEMTLIDSATGQKVILVNGCLVNTADPNSSEPPSPPCILLHYH